MPVPPYRAIAERRVTDRLLQANAVWPGNGRAIDVHRGSERRALQRLVASGVIRAEGDGRYYVDAPAYAARMASRRRRTLIALLWVIGAALGAGVLSSL
jgi:hypothetical protein